MFHSNRRQLLRNAAILSTASCLPSRIRALYADNWVPLGQIAATKNLLFGFALNYRLLSDPTYQNLAARECTVIVPENAMKWEAVHPELERYSFEQADAIVSFAESHSMKVRGHTFCWHRALPPWFTREVNRQNAEAVLRKHIATVAGHYKGRIHSWDVVNEAIQWKDNQPNGWRNSPWYQLLGPAYVDIAFQATHEADPTAILGYNDFGLEYENAADSQKRKTVLALLKELKKRGIPIRALGIQSHLRAGTNEKFAYDLPAFINEVKDLGMHVFITEMDVDDSHLTLNGNDRDEVVADVYKRYLDLVLSTGAVDLVITWGAWDMAHQVGPEVTSGPVAQHPLLFTPQGAPKLDAKWVAKSFQQSPTHY